MLGIFFYCTAPLHHLSDDSRYRYHLFHHYLLQKISALQILGDQLGSERFIGRLSGDAAGHNLSNIGRLVFRLYLMPHMAQRRRTQLHR